MEHLASTRVAIIGAGFSGLMTAYHLLHRSPRSSVTIFERAPQQLAVGNAYAPSSPHHILNVPAAAMGARAENPKEFLTWLSAHGRDVAPTAFVSRAWYGEYLRDLFASLAATFPSRLRTVQEEVISLRRLSHGALAMQSELGAETVVDHVVLATGTTPRVVPTSGDPEALRRRVVMHPWQRSALKDAGPNETIALIGSGLSAIDILVESTKSGFSGTFHVIAPRAWFPCVHAEDLSPVPPLAKPPEWRSVRQALRELRLLSKSYAEWQHAIDAVRPHLNSIWCALPECERERFFRHGALLWDKHRHRMPRSAGAVIDSLKAAGRLRIESGHVVAVAAEASKVTLTVFNRSTANTSEIIADRAVNCTGFTLDVQQSPSPLTRSIMSTQLGFPGAHRFGWRTALSGALVTLSDEPITGMWAIGALRRGIEFESTAARELRVQAEELANKILRVSLDQSEPATAARSAFPP